MSSSVPSVFSWAGKKVVVTGGAGFLGRFVLEKLAARGVKPQDIFVPRRTQFDLTNQTDAARLYRTAFGQTKVDVVIHLAAEVGGIGANRANPGRYFFANMAMALHLIEQARLDGLIERDGRFVQVGTICAYPKFTPVPFREEDLWNGYPEETNAPYGVAKKAAWQMLDAYKLQYAMKSAYVLPVNLYGPYDNFDLNTSHVIPALIRKCVEAQERGDKEIVCWGTGTASREFLYVEDAAEGIVRAAETMCDPEPINLGAGFEIKIKDLVELIVKLTGFKGGSTWDATKPDGQPRRQLSVDRAAKMLDWRAKMGFEEGLAKTIEWFRKNHK
ncbi:GDP-L-fucose synthase family protein [Limnofasciculus baicalensis]|uniref:GDP-L-fucose synthase n=1 Tax=Limnofasciculus baicalensis BBK-W-15 TaxID=2699891 RepID=A0AAE3GZ58_9CYAN|nr:GDP-L-fucose synthase [Limnofasciculus baicalensis]MCP2732498.1 GDP-L-fucose synthase [Limnofasciculus baicalensis BBK-W-15]